MCMICVWYEFFTICVWYKYAYDIEHYARNITTPRSGIPHNFARKNVSVSLWVNNARMILRHWA